MASSRGIDKVEEEKIKILEKHFNLYKKMEEYISLNRQKSEEERKLKIQGH